MDTEDNHLISKMSDLRQKREDLVNQQKDLETAQDDFKRTGLDAYLDDADNDNYAIRETEHQIAQLEEAVKQILSEKNTPDL